MKLKSVYVCSNCGETSPRWMGRCPSCGSWNTMNEDVVAEAPKAGTSAARQADRLRQQRQGFFRFSLFIDPHTLFSPLMYSICQIDQRSACLRLRRVTPSSPPMQPQSSTARMRHTTADSAAVPFHTAESTSGAARNVL